MSSSSEAAAVQPGGNEPTSGNLIDFLGPRLSPAVAFATTEHFNLQTARSLTVAEANGRATIYLATLSSSLIALAFIGQESQLEGAFLVSTLILLPVLAFVGLVTFLRLVQSSIEDMAYARRIGLLRAFYLRVAPELEPYLVVRRAPETTAATPRGSLRQLALTVAGMVAAVNSVVIAACGGFVLVAVGADSPAVSIAGGGIAGLGAFWLHERHHCRQWEIQSPKDVDWGGITIPPIVDLTTLDPTQA